MRHFELKTRPRKSKALGRACPHESAVKQVAGVAHFIDDVAVPLDCLHAYPVMATVAKGKVLSIDQQDALACQGVQCILGSKDILGHKDIGPIFPGDALMAEQDIVFHGQVLLLVLAETYQQARYAARQVQVQYECEQPLLDVQQAIKEQAWVRPPHTLQRGDVDQALTLAKHRLSGELHVGGQEHFYLEGQVSLVIPQEGGGMLVQSSTQHPSEVQHLVAGVLGLAFNQVVVETRRMGGAFGGKETQAAQWACLAALAAHYSGRAVKLRLARADDFKLTGKRHPFFNRYDIGFDEQGVIQGVALDVTGVCGHSPDLSDAIVDRAMFHADNGYFYPHVRITGHRAFSNTVSHTAFRGFGGPQGMIMAEAMLDNIAYALQEDPLTIRKRNLYRPGYDVTPYHQKIEQHVLLDMLNTLERQSHYVERRQQIEQFNQQSPIIKKGLALTPVKFGISFTVQHLNQAGALLHIYTDGSIHLNHGGTEMGQGLFTKVAQVVAQALGVELSLIQVSATRTDKVPNTSPTAASSGADLNGMAALNAAMTLRQRLEKFLAEHFKVPLDSIEFVDGQVHYGIQASPASNSGVLSFAEVAELAYMHRISLSANGYYSTPKIHYDRKAGAGRPFFYFAHGVACTEVEVDMLTGENAVTRVDILHDVGHSLNPALDLGQIEGAFIQGMGWLTTEDLQWRENGELSSLNPATYKIPAIGDTPAVFNVQLYDAKNPETTVFRSKAVGEPPFMLGISVWCALRHAISSVCDGRWAPPLDPPATAEKIMLAVQQAREWVLAQSEEGEHGKP